MISEEEEDSSSDRLEKSSKLRKLSLKSLEELKILESNHLLDYIDYLHNLLQKKDRKLKRQKSKIKGLVKINKSLKTSNKTRETKSTSKTTNGMTRSKESMNIDAKTTTITNDNDDNDIRNDIEAKTAFGFVDEMRQVAQQAQTLGHLVYEPLSGLYYDKNSGYYYNAEYGLYYDGNTGCYYNYNNEKKTYEFHSQVQVQSTTASNKSDKIIKKNAEYYLQADANNPNDRNQAAADDDDDLAVNDVIFDEFGVVTDQQKLQQLHAKRLLENEMKHHHRRTQSNKKQTKSLKTDNDDETIPTKANANANAFNRKKPPSKRRKHKDDQNNSPSDVRMDVEHLKKEKTLSNDIEDGELPSSSSSSSNSNSADDNDDDKYDDNDKSAKVPMFKCQNRYQDIAKKYPPSLRIIVQETNLKNLKVGSLSLITYKGGSLGREGSHDVIIPDVNVSKNHLKFIYDTKRSLYKCIDLGSRNGTILNGQPLLGSKDDEHSYDLVHGSCLQIAQTKLLCHVHEGNSTCGLCEPGLLIDSSKEQAAATNANNSITLTRKEQLKKIQKKYGLENEKFLDNNGKQNTGNYNDRAASRRLKVGSSSDKEKTQVASIDKEISSDNKGFKMLSKLGWNKGETLGKTNATSGLLEPINVETNTGTRGLGCQDSLSQMTLTNAEKRKLDRMKRTQERYNNTDIFQLNEDSI